MQSKKKFTVKNGNGVKEFHFQDEMNYEFRKTMEDYFFVQDRYLDTCAKSILFGMFDGHGGDKVSSYLAKNFSAILLHQIKNCKKNFKSAFERAYNILDQKIRSQIPQSDQMGSTSTVGLILYEQSQRVLYISHVGDSSAFLFDDKNAEKLTLQHRGENPAQKQRVKNAGGAILANRLAGVLAVTRAFGDFGLKKFGLISVPEVKRVELRLHHKFLIIASDGLWDYISSADILTTIKEEIEVEDISKKILKRAMKNGSTDNISIIILKL